MLFLELLSYLFGWIYFTCWSISFYPQALLNWRRRSTSGTTIDFPFINIFGFLAYLISNGSFYWSTLIRQQYAARNNDFPPTVTFNDVVFAAHGLFMCFVTTSQYVFPRAWGFERSPGTKPSHFVLGVLSGSILAIFIVISTVILGSGGPNADSKISWAWIDVVYSISYIKLLFTVVKYAPQLLYNFRNRSTVGWSISMILLDFAGGVLSIAQLVIDSWLMGDWSGITGNPAKFWLGNITIIYDVLFIMQHFVLYKHSEVERLCGKDGEDDGLLEAYARRLLG